MAKATDIQFTIGLDTAGFTKAFTSLQKTVSNNLSTIRNLSLGLGALFGAAFSAKHIARLISQTSTFAGQLNDIRNRLRSVESQFFTAILTKLSPVIEFFVSSIEGVLPFIIDAAETFSEGILKGVTILINAFKQGRLSELIYLSVQVGFMKGVDFALGALRGLTNAFTEILGQAMSVLFTGSFWSSFADAMIGVFKVAGNSAVVLFLELLETPLKALQDGLTYVFEQVFARWNKFFGKQSTVRTFDQIQKQDKLSLFGESKEGFKKNILQGYSQIKDAGTQFQQSLQKAGVSMESILKAFKEGMASGGVFGEVADDKLAQLKNLFEELSEDKLPESKKVRGGTFAGSNAFDSLRKIGGGLSSGITDVPRQQLDVLREISRNTGQLLTKGPAPAGGSYTGIGNNGFMAAGGF